MYTIEEYEAKREARYNSLLAAAEKAEKESHAAHEQGSQMASIIPFGQPILVGHHSEGRDRNYRERIHNKFRKGYELAKKAEEYKSRAASTASNDAIYSDNPQAVDLLTEKVNELKAEQAEMKRINTALRKGADFDTLEMSDTHRKDLTDVEKYQAYYQPRKRGFPPYMLTSVNTKLKTAEKRAALVEKKQSIPDKDEEINGIKIEWRASENRIRVIFPARVDMETYKKLKRHGYRAMKEAGSFSAYYNFNAGQFVNDLRKSNKEHQKQEEQYSQSFPNTEEGTTQANQYMEQNKNASVIEVTAEEIRISE